MVNTDYFHKQTSHIIRVFLFEFFERKFFWILKQACYPTPSLCINICNWIFLLAVKSFYKISWVSTKVFWNPIDIITINWSVKAIFDSKKRTVFFWNRSYESFKCIDVHYCFSFSGNKARYSSQIFLIVAIRSSAYQ